MKNEQCSFIPKTPKEHRYRAVAFLKYDAMTFVNAHPGFEGLDEETRDFFQTSFDYFLEDLTLTRYPHRYHGWKKTNKGGKYQYCFVFKRPPHRLYGFLCHPKEPEDRQYYMCVLVVYASKKKDLTDPEDLKRTEKMRTDPKVQNALRKFVAKETKWRL